MTTPPGDDDEVVEMSPEDIARWQTARTLADLARLTALWLEGTIASRPGFNGRPADETIPLIAVLATANKAGFLTDDSQPGESRDEHGNAQRAAVMGYATTDTLCELCRHIVRTPITVIAHAPASQGSVEDAKMPVTLDEGYPYTLYGGRMRREWLREMYGDRLHPAAVGALCDAWQVTLIDPEWGRNDVL